MSTEKSIEIEEDNIVAKTSKKIWSVKMGCLNFLDASLDDISSTLKSFLFLDANRMENERFKRFWPIHMKKVKLLNHFLNHLN